MRTSRSLLALAALVSAQLAGCSRPTPPPAAPAAPAVVTKTAAIEKPASQPAADKVAKDKLAKDEKPAASVEEKPAVPPDRPERLLVLTPGAPLIIDVSITLDGRPHAAAFDELVKQVLDAADTDKDGRATWKEFVANKEFLATPLGGGRSDAYQGRMWIEQHDVNANNFLEPEEARSWLGRDGGGGASAFSVRSSRSYPPNPRANSRVWQTLDADADGALSAAEIEAAPRALLAADADDDLTIAPLELASLREQLASAGGGPTPIPRDATRYAVLELEPDADVDRLQYLLSDLYAPRQSLNPDSFALLPNLFAQLDVDHDGVLDQIDLNRFNKIEPHLALAVDFAKSPAKGHPAATLQIQKSAPELTILGPPAPDRVIAILGGTRLIISANDLAPGDANMPVGAGAGARHDPRPMRRFVRRPRRQLRRPARRARARLGAPVPLEARRQRRRPAHRR